MATFRVNSEQLQGTAGQIGAAQERIMGEIGAVIRQVEGTRDFWEGNAQGTYTNLMAEWRTAADRVQTALRNTVDALNRAADDYATTESNQVTRFGNG